MLIPPELRARLRDLRLSARSAAGAGGIGMHASRNRGAGLEFAQYRGYEPGDEPRRIDWKLYARSDRYFVRESERDSPLCIWLVIDASASMAQADAQSPAWDKLAAAKMMAACVIELALRQGDRFGLIALSATAPAFVEAGSGARPRDRSLLVIDGIPAGEGQRIRLAALPRGPRLGRGKGVELADRAQHPDAQARQHEHREAATQQPRHRKRQPGRADQRRADEHRPPPPAGHEPGQRMERQHRRQILDGQRQRGPAGRRQQPDAHQRRGGQHQADDSHRQRLTQCQQDNIAVHGCTPEKF